MSDLPAPLPPGERPVGQLVAETMRVYGAQIWRALPLGIPLGVVNAVSFGHGNRYQVVVLIAAAPAFAAASVWAACLALRLRPTRRALLAAWGLGTGVWLLWPPLLILFVVPGVVWLSVAGLVVPVMLVEGLSPRAAVARARSLALADIKHLVGGLLALLVVVFLSAVMMIALLHSQGAATRRTAAFLAPLVLSPLVFLGGALLYVDQVARAAAGAVVVSVKPTGRRS